MCLSSAYQLSIAYLHVQSDFPFTEHLRHLFDVISSLDCGKPGDLLRLQRFIHHRAYRKLGYRVLDFSQHWGTSPFVILLQNIDPTLKPKKFQLNLDRSFRSYLVRFGLFPDREQGSKYSFTINPTNALQWGDVLMDAWDRLQKKVLVSTVTGDGTLYEVDMDPPTNRIVIKIVVWIKVLEVLLNPVLRYLASSSKVGDALARAGEI